MPDLLIKKKPTLPQVGLSGSARRQNLRGAFAVNPRYTPITDHRSLIIFDDVYTTGSTLKEAIKALRLGGFKKICTLTLAR